MTVVPVLVLATIRLAAAPPSIPAPPARYELTKVGHVSRQPYDRFSTHDRFGREITFYLSEAPPPGEALPLVVYVHGSGCASHFHREGDRIVPANGHITLQEVSRGKARVLIVEKPGVQWLDDPTPPDEQEGSLEFRREHTLDRWAEAIEAAIQAARRAPGIDLHGMLVLGHSEGGLVAGRVARDLPDAVTHVATLAGGGPTQLYDLVALARKGSFFREVSDDPERRVRYVLDQWSAIRSDPTSVEKTFFGFAFRRWSSFLSSSLIEELAGVRARIYIAQGLDDAAVDPTSSDVLAAQLQARGKEIVYDRVAGADHSFHLERSPELDGWKDELTRILRWFLASRDP